MYTKPPPSEVLLDQTYTNANDPLAAGYFLKGCSPYRWLQIWCYSVAFTGGTSPTISLGGACEPDDSGTAYAGSKNVGTTGNISANGVGVLEAGVGAGNATGQYMNGRVTNTVRLSSSVAGAPTAYSYRVRVIGYY